MHQNGDAAHMEAMNKMGELMNSPEAMKQWMDGKQKEIESLPNR